jgi:hypothetical protein
MEFRRVCVFWEGEAFKCSDQQLMNLHSTPIAGREGTPDAKEEEDEVYGGKATAEMKKGSRGEHIEKKKRALVFSHLLLLRILVLNCTAFTQKTNRKKKGSVSRLFAGHTKKSSAACSTTNVLEEGENLCRSYDALSPSASFVAAAMDDSVFAHEKRGVQKTSFQFWLVGLS